MVWQPPAGGTGAPADPTSISGIDVKAYGAQGDGIANDTPAIQSAIDATSAAGGGTVYFPPGTYSLLPQIDLKTGVTLSMYGAKLKIADGSNSHAIRIPSGVTNVAILGGTIDGNKANNTAGSGIQSQNASIVAYITIRDVYVYDCKDHGIFIVGIDPANPTRYVTIQGCTVRAVGQMGIAGSYIEEFSWMNNIVTASGQYGIVLLGSGKYGTISGNTVSSSVASNFAGTHQNNAYLTITSNISRDSGNVGMNWGGRSITVSNNAIYNPANIGIFANITAAIESVNMTINDNVIDGVKAGAGIAVSKVNGFTVSGNSILSSVGNGIYTQNTCLRGTISGNVCHLNGGSGILILNSSYSSVTGNSCNANVGNGIDLNDSTGISVKANLCSGNAVPFRESGTTCNFNHIAANHFAGNTSDAVSMYGVNTVYEGGNLNGGTNNLASAATLYLSRYTDYLVVTGTTSITSIAATWGRRRVILRFEDVLTVTDGGNLKLNGNFVTSAGATLTLVCDGVDYWEVSRSTN